MGESIKQNAAEQIDDAGESKAEVPVSPEMQELLKRKNVRGIMAGTMKAFDSNFARRDEVKADHVAAFLEQYPTAKSFRGVGMKFLDKIEAENDVIKRAEYEVALSDFMNEIYPEFDVAMLENVANDQEWVGDVREQGEDELPEMYLKESLDYKDLYARLGKLRGNGIQGSQAFYTTAGLMTTIKGIEEAVKAAPGIDMTRELQFLPGQVRGIIRNFVDREQKAQ